MVTLYKKIEKSKGNLHGFEELKVEDIPLLHPTMICLSAQSSRPKSAFGIVREGMRAARLRTSQGVAAKYALKDFPINFIGLTYDYKDKDLGVALAEDYFLPLVSKDGKKINIEQAKKNMRNITIMSYCDGTIVYSNFESRLVSLMQELGYTDREITEILSELALIGVLTMRDTSKCLATTFQIVDVNDSEIFDEATPKLINSLDRQQTNHDFIQIGNNNGMYYFKGSGEHSIKTFFKNDYLPHAMMSAIVSQCLTRSIDSNHDFNFSNMQRMINSIINHHNVGFTPDEILYDLDAQINYPDARKLSDAECELLDTIDELSRKANNFENDNHVLKSANTTQNEKYKKLEEAVKSTVSETDYMIILQKIGYQFSQEELKKLEETKSKNK